MKKINLTIYYPLQIPFVLNQRFAEVIRYTEEDPQSLGDFVICFWEMTPLTKQETEVDNVIVTDGCVDLVVDYDSKQIGYNELKGRHKILCDVHTTFYGSKEFAVTDNNGYVLTFAENREG
jgi:hypothetical protein